MEDRGHGLAAGAAGAGGGEQEGAPGSDALGEGEDVEDVEGFEGGAFEAGLVEEVSGVEEAVELEGASADEQGADLGGALLLVIDPGEIGAGLEGEDPGAPERRLRAAGDVGAELRPGERGRARFGEGMRDFGE